MADYIILTLCWGARRSEAASLKVVDVDFKKNSLSSGIPKIHGIIFSR